MGLRMGRPKAAPCTATSRVTEKIFTVLVEWCHIVLTMSFKMVFFTFIFAVLLPRVGECRRVSNVFVGCVTVNNLFHRPVAAP